MSVGGYRGWQNQDTIYVIMYKSKISGATLTEVRRTEGGKNRLLETLYYLEVDPHNIIVTEQKKVWMPDPKKKGERMLEIDARNSGTGRKTLR